MSDQESHPGNLPTYQDTEQFVADAPTATDNPQAAVVSVSTDIPQGAINTPPVDTSTPAQVPISLPAQAAASTSNTIPALTADCIPSTPGQTGKHRQCARCLGDDEKCNGKSKEPRVVACQRCLDLGATEAAECISGKLPLAYLQSKPASTNLTRHRRLLEAEKKHQL